MKLVRFGEKGAEKPGLIDSDGNVRSLEAHITDFDETTLDQPEFTALSSVDPASLPLVGPAEELRLGSCVGRISKLVCFGLNERKHSEEMGIPLTDDPTLFMKALSTINGPHDPVVYPRVGKAVDWEAELAIVIGRTGKYIERDQARSHIAGFCIINDVSDRYWQFDRGGQATKGKSFDTFAPLGPWLVTPDDVPDPTSLSIRLWVNDELRQDYSSADYILNVYEIVSYCSQLFTLRPGDIIAMGSGPGNAHHSGNYLKPGDVMKIEIDCLGQQVSKLVEEA